MTTTLTARNHLVTLMVEDQFGAMYSVPGPWKTFSGGGISAETTVNRPGGMADREVLPGVSEREAITLEREYKWDRDAALIGRGGFLDAAAQIGSKAVVTVQSLDARRQQVGPSQSYVGRISSASRGDLDSESSDVATMTVEIVADN